MDFDTFSRRAERILSRIPREYLEGVVSIEIHREQRRHPRIAGYYTLGECSDDPVSRMSDPEVLRSRVDLFYGSFAVLARSNPAFDWDAELEETILHEIRHHLEDRAGVRDLSDRDAEGEVLARFYADDETLSPRFYRMGERMEPGVWRVGDDLFVELGLRPADLDRFRGKTMDLAVLTEPLVVEIPEDAELGDVLELREDGLERDDGTCGNLHVVL